MLGHCPCVAEGTSSHAIARAFGHCSSGGKDHPYDPSDLARCMRYIKRTSISTKRLQEVMAPVSPTWRALVSEWDSLTALFDEEKAEGTGKAPRLYARMAEIRREAAA